MEKPRWLLGYSWWPNCEAREAKAKGLSRIGGKALAGGGVKIELGFF